MGILKRAKSFFTGPDRSASRERRKLKRIACQQQFLATRGKESFPLTVVDVGFGGFRVLSDDPLGERGTLLHIRRLPNDFRRHLTGAYTSGLMVKVAWVKASEGQFEAGLSVPETPGSMRLNWYRELLGELGFDEKTVFSKRASRRHRCRLPAELRCGELPPQKGILLDMSSGGALFGEGKAAPMGTPATLAVEWGRERLELGVGVVGVRTNTLDDSVPRWLHSLKFEEGMSQGQEKILFRWLEDLAEND